MRIPNFAAFALVLVAAGLAGAQTVTVPNYDGQRPRGGSVPDPVAPGQTAAGANATADPDGFTEDQRALFDGLMERVQIKAADPEAKALIKNTFKDIVRTRTGAEMTQRFIEEHALAVVMFDKVPNSDTAVDNGKVVLRASGGNTDTSETPPVIRLNEDYLKTDPAWRRTNMADTLGHEMFGHGLENQRAASQSVSGSIHHYRGDEANSGLIGWLIGVELGGPTDDYFMWQYIRQPEAYHKALLTNLAFYAGTFSVSEMADPLATLKTRRDNVEKARKRQHEDQVETDSWRPVIEHFITVHGRARGDFKNLIDSIDAVDRAVPLRDKDYDEIVAYIDRMDKDWRGKGAAELETLKRDSQSPYYAGQEQRLEVLRRRLEQETAGRHEEPSVPPVPGQITWEELYKMTEEDRRVNPSHLPK